jgi:hypothetical protein
MIAILPLMVASFAYLIASLALSYLIPAALMRGSGCGGGQR